MKFAVALCLLISTASLTACKTTVSDCTWVEPIEFADETKDWLGGLDWPQSAYADFNQIGDHNALHGRFCN